DQVAAEGARRDGHLRVAGFVENGKAAAADRPGVSAGAPVAPETSVGVPPAKGAADPARPGVSAGAGRGRVSRHDDPGEADVPRGAAAGEGAAESSAARAPGPGATAIAAIARRRRVAGNAAGPARAPGPADATDTPLHLV